MTDGDALLRAILDAPDDDAPRLVYADWLDENGQSERAEFIRVQIRKTPALSAGCVHTICHHEVECFNCCQCEWCKLRRRERELLAANEHWCSLPFPSYARTGETTPTPARNERQFRRGFLEVITCTAADCLAHLDAIREQHPVREVRLTTPIDWYYEVDAVILRAGQQTRPAKKVAAGWAANGFATYIASVLAAEWPGITFHLSDTRTLRERLADDGLLV